MSGLLKMLAVMGKMYDKEMDAQRTGLYSKYLLDRYTEGEILEAGRSLIYSSRFMPTVADFTEAIEGKPDTLDNRLKDEAINQWNWLTASSWAEGHPPEFSKEVCRDVTGTIHLDGMKARDLMFMRKEFLERYVYAKTAEMREDAQKRRDEIASTGRDVAGLIE